VGRLYLIFIVLLAIANYSANAQELPEEELQVNISSYFDNFNVNVVYPDISVKKSLSETTGINGRFLVDVMSCASMRSIFKNVYSTQHVKTYNNDIDAYTSATKNLNGGGDNDPDDYRLEGTFGITHILGDWTLSLTNIYSYEKDYTSNTLIGKVSMPFAKKNTIVDVGLIRSWDKISPQVKHWTADKDVISCDVSITQILGKNLLSQLNLSYSNAQGFLAEPYQVVKIFDFQHEDPAYSRTVQYYEPISPEHRNRVAAGLRTIYGLSEVSSITMGYRIYRDDWEIMSHTLSALYQRSFSDDKIIMGLGFRYYTQSSAYFYKKHYDTVYSYMTVDSKMKEMYTNDIHFNINVAGDKMPLIDNEDINFISSIRFYWRHTDSPDWHSGLYDLYAYMFSIGFKYSI
jgi:hypothetical protein